MNCIYFQLACWLTISTVADAVKSGKQAKVETPVTPRWHARLKFLFLERASGAMREESLSYRDHYADGLCSALMTRLRSVTTNENGFAPVIASPALLK